MINRCPGRYLIFYPRPRASRKLYCFPFAGGGAAAYRDWAMRAPSDVEVVACQMPGRHGRYWEPHPDSMQQMAADFARDFIKEHDGRSFMFFGHSLGALVAFLVAQNLELRAGVAPLRLGLSARSAPQHQARVKLSMLPQDELLKVLTALGGIPREILANEELTTLLMKPLIADLKLSDSYRFQATKPLAAPIPEVFSGSDDQMVEPGSLEAWASLFVHPLRMHRFQGGHFFLWKETEQILGEMCAAPSEDSAFVMHARTSEMEVQR